MKVIKLFTILFLFSTLVISAQEINQFDAAGKRHGLWKKYFDGTELIRYQGNFVNGKEVGEFKFYKNIRGKAVLTAIKVFNPDNDIAEVSFLGSNKKVISSGKMDGKKYIGAWKYYQKRNDNLLILEHYNDAGLLNGERLVYYDNGQIAEKQNYINGKLNGDSFWYSQKGVVLKSFLYRNDELHGPSKIYNGKGELLIEGQYKAGKKTGVWKYYEKGVLKEEKDFDLDPKTLKQ